MVLASKNTEKSMLSPICVPVRCDDRVDAPSPAVCGEPIVNSLVRFVLRGGVCCTPPNKSNRETTNKTAVNVLVDPRRVAKKVFVDLHGSFHGSVCHNFTLDLLDPKKSSANSIDRCSCVVNQRENRLLAKNFRLDRAGSLPWKRFPDNEVRLHFGVG